MKSFIILLSIISLAIGIVFKADDEFYVLSLIVAALMWVMAVSLFLFERGCK